MHYIRRDYLGSITQVTNSSGSLVRETGYDAWGKLRVPNNMHVYTPDTEPELFLGRGYTGHEHLPYFGLINMNARLYDPALGRFLSPDPYVQAPDFTQSFNRYSYCMNNPLKFTDPDGEIAWFIPVIAAAVGAGINLWANWDNIEGFWDGLATFGVGALAGALTTATAGGSIWATTGVAGGTGALVGTNNSLVAQTGANFSGISSVDWGDVGVSAAAGGVSGFAAGAVGAGASSLPSINGIQSPMLKSLVISPIASGAGHVGGGTAANLFGGQSLAEAFGNSFQNIGTSMAIGTAVGLGSTYATLRASGINPWTGKLDFKFKLTDVDRDLRIYEVTQGDKKFLIGGDMNVMDNKLIIKGFSIDGSSTNNLGVREFTNSFGKYMKVHEVHIYGSKRTTGASPGKYSIYKHIVK